MKTENQTKQLLEAGKQLRLMLARCEISCGSLWHRDGERHRFGESCPVVAKIEAAQKAWDETDNVRLEPPSGNGDGSQPKETNVR